MRRKRKTFRPDSKRFLARFLTRTSAVILLGLSLFYSLLLGGHLDYEGSPWLRLPGKIAGLAGMAADGITVRGLKRHDAEMVLTAISIKPGASLVGFDVVRAKKLLENVDWVQSASVQRRYPNQLAIEIIEREPFAIWQRAGSYYLIDKTGVAMGGVENVSQSDLLLVTGEGAQNTTLELVKQLEETPELKMHVRAAARVGQRRWTLYLDGGVTIALPQEKMSQALAKAERLIKERILTRAISNIDLRLADRIVIAQAIEPKVKSVAGGNRGAEFIVGQASKSLVKTNE